VIRIRVNPEAWAKWKFIQYQVLSLGPAFELRADVYHAHDVYTLNTAGLAATLHGSALVYESRELFTGLTSLASRPIERCIWSAVERAWIGRCDGVITVSDSIAGMLAERYRIGRPEVIRNFPVVERVERSDLLRRKLDIPQDRKILIYQGMLTRGRGVLELVEAVAGLGDAELVVVGEGPEGPRIEMRARELGISDRVHLIGFVPREELLRYTASADIGVHLMQNISPNHYYALPNKIFEYAMAGLPVVASNFPEIGKVLSAHRFGIPVDPSDREGTVEALRRLIRDDALRRELAHNARRASEVLNWERESLRLVRFYEKLEGEIASRSKRHNPDV